MFKSVRARFTGGVFKPLEEIELGEGAEVVISFDDKPPLTAEERLKVTKSAAGAWKGKIDGEAMKREIYEARRSGSRVEPDEY